MLLIQGQEVKYQLTFLESLGAFAKSPRARVSNLLSIKYFENPWTSVLRGIRLPGTGIPYVIMLGTMRYRGGKDFTVVYKRRPVWVLEFRDEEYERWVIPAEPNRSAVSELQRQISGGGGS